MGACCDHCHCPAPYTYCVWQKGYFHPFPLIVGFQNPLIFLITFLTLSFLCYHVYLPFHLNNLKTL